MTSILTWKSNLVRELVKGGWLIGPKLFRPEAYPACASPKLCEIIYQTFLQKLSFPNPVLKFVLEGEGEKKTTFVRPTQLGFRFDFDSQKGPKGGKGFLNRNHPKQNGTKSYFPKHQSSPPSSSSSSWVHLD